MADKAKPVATYGDYYVDGGSVANVSEGGRNYAVWRVFHVSGELVCGFFGPMSLHCATVAAKNLSDRRPTRPD